MNFHENILKFFKIFPSREISIFLILTSLFLFTMMDACAKLLIQTYPSNQVIWARYATQCFVSIIVLSPILIKVLFTENLKIQLLRSTFSFFATFFFFTSLRYMPLAEANAIFQLSPIIVTILSSIILKEFVGIGRWCGVFLGMIGALIIIRPGSEVFSLSLIFPVLAAFSYASYLISTRYLSKEESTATNFIYVSLVGTLIASMFVFQDWKPIKNSDLFLFFIIGLIGTLAHFALIYAFKISQASFLAPFNYMHLLFSGFWGFLLFSEIPTLITIVGATLIIFAGIFIWIKDKK